MEKYTVQSGTGARTIDITMGVIETDRPTIERRLRAMRDILFVRRNGGRGNLKRAGAHTYSITDRQGGIKNDSAAIPGK